MIKDWVDYRYEEMEEKAGVTQLPEFDMDVVDSYLMMKTGRLKRGMMPI